MKKNLFFLAAAAVALASCSSDETTAVNSSASQANQPKEIAFMPLAQAPTRAAISSFTDEHFYLAAYNATNSSDYFDGTEYSKESEGTWAGTSTKRYWPLGDAVLNFLAITKPGSTVPTFGTGEPKASFASSVAITLPANNVNQYDLLYSCARATVSSVTGGFSFNNGGTAGVQNVSMAFKHAQSLINFTVKTAGTYTGTTITLTSITLNDAIYTGTCTVGLANYNSTSETLTATPVWSAVTDPTTSNPEVVAPQSTADLEVNSSSSGEIGSGVLVVPNPNETSSILNESFKSFTIAYKINDKPYTFTYAPTDTDRRLLPGKKYVFNITFTLTEIKVTPSVTDWENGGTPAVPVP